MNGRFDCGRDEGAWPRFPSCNERSKIFYDILIQYLAPVISTSGVGIEYRVLCTEGRTEGDKRDMKDSCRKYLVLVSSFLTIKIRGRSRNIWLYSSYLPVFCCTVVSSSPHGLTSQRDGTHKFLQGARDTYSFT